MVQKQDIRQASSSFPPRAAVLGGSLELCESVSVFDKSLWKWHTSLNARRLGSEKSALGFLLSYAALVSYESDIFIVQETYLLSDNITSTPKSFIT